MSGLRFCMVTTFYPPYNFGGDGIGIQRLSRALVKAGHHVTVVHDADAYHALHPEAPPGQPTPEDGVEIVRLESGLRILSPLLTQQLGRPVVHARRLRRLLDGGDWDVVNFHNISLVGGPGVLGLGGNAVRLYMAHEHWLVCPMHVLWRHGRELCTGRECLKCTVVHRRPPQLWRYTGMLERELRHVDAVVAMSEFSREKHREFGFPREMEVLPYFLPDDAPAADAREAAPVAAAPVHDRPYFLFVGRLERIKGLDDVIPVFRDYPDADLLIAGDGEYAETLRAQAAGNPRVRFLGRLTPSALRAYYEQAIALVVPSVCYETFGIILIEAFRQGTPVIARRLGPFPELVEQSGAGLLFSTPDDLLVALRRFQHEPGLRDRLSAAGLHAHVERWSERVVVPQYLDIVRRAAGRRGHHRVIQHLSSLGIAS